MVRPHFFACLLVLCVVATLSLRTPFVRAHYNRGMLLSKGTSDYEYSNPITKALEAFLPTPIASSSLILDEYATRPKRRKTSLQALARDLDKALNEKEWFVTGEVDSRFFSDEFRFQDPDVKVTGIQEYAKGVRKLFDQGCTRGEVISTAVNNAVPNTITVQWRLDGRVNIGRGVNIKAFIVYTDLLIDDNGLIVFQEDKFSLPSYDILLSAFFPFLYTDMKLLAPPAPAAAMLRKTLR